MPKYLKLLGKVHISCALNSVSSLSQIQCCPVPLKYTTRIFFNFKQSINNFYDLDDSSPEGSKSSLSISRCVHLH